ncbi:hypothetical protein [Photobacterium leiognathi]|uniref:hypothetical protein n=1 Tax=Photobacterium leiognathi TaxID=553611 RepID=UPI001EE091C2|nr:hypothetical protein [Photobacterium leiognathi]MCG3886287.1 hypothetical protein [Photobacterium leiognathi]
MKQIFDEIKVELKQFVDDGENTYFCSSINSLSFKLENHYPKIPDVAYPLAELRSYAHQLTVAEYDEVQKFYHLCLGRLEVLENKVEQAGAI